MGFMLMLAGLLLFGAGLWMVIAPAGSGSSSLDAASSPAQVAEAATEQTAEPAPEATALSAPAAAAPPAPAEQPAPAPVEKPAPATVPLTERMAPAVEREPSATQAHQDNLAKGDAFEEWVVAHFSRDLFDVVERSSDKPRDPRKYGPDVLLRYVGPKSGGELFYVECKWRQSLGKYGYCSEQNLDNYRGYAAGTLAQSQHTALPVYIVLGVGGEPSSPERVYVIPLAKAQAGYVDEDDLESFRRHRGDTYTDSNRFCYYANGQGLV